MFPDTALDALDGATVTGSGDAGRVYDLRVSRLHDGQEREFGHALVLRDLTARNRYEQRLEVANRVLRHNLRNDTTVIRGYAEMLQNDGSVAPPNAGDRIRTTAERLISLSEKSREITRFEPGAGNGATVDVTSSVERLLREYESAHPDVAFEFDVPDRARASVAHDSAATTAVETSSRTPSSTTTPTDRACG